MVKKTAVKKYIGIAAIIVAVVLLCIFFINKYKNNPIHQYPQNECSKKICKYMDREEISGCASLIEENKIEIYVDRDIELYDTDIKVDTETINKLISQVEYPYLCSIRIDKDYGRSSVYGVESIVIANFTPKDLQPYVQPIQISESDITEQNSHSEHFYYMYTSFFPNDVIDSSMPEITNLTIYPHHFFNRQNTDVSEDFEFLKYLPNLEHMKIIHTTNGECRFENSDENIEQLKKLLPEDCVIEFEN